MIPGFIRRPHAWRSAVSSASWLLLGLMGACGSSQAFPVVFQFGGTLYDVAPQVTLSEAALKAGDKFSGYVQVDTEGPRAADGSYEIGVIFDLTVAGWHFGRTVAGGPGGLYVQNGQFDWFHAHSIPTESPVFANPYVGPMELVDFVISLGDYSGLAISDVAANQLPRNADIDFSKFTVRDLGLHFSVGGLEPGYTFGDIEYFNSSLPEPGSAALALSALAAAALSARKRTIHMPKQ